MILCSNPLAQYLSHKDGIDAAIARVLSGGRYILGDETRGFEQAFADYCGVKSGIGVGSGTEALHLAIRACGIGAGDEVITVSHTAVATVSAIELAGAKAILVDVDPDYYLIRTDDIEAAITSRTKAIIPVHLYGQPADLEAITRIARTHGLRVIEDCAQAHGAMAGSRRVGSVGDVGCFSFYPTKNLGAIGDGGMLVTSDSEIAEQARLLREYGWRDRYTSEVPGWNTRLDEIQAAILQVKLATLDADNAARVRLADRYDAALAGLKLETPKRRADGSHVFHLYVIRSAQRDALQAHLKSRGVGALIHYPVPVHQQPAYAGRLGGKNSLPQTERAAREILSLPMYPELTEAEQDAVIEAVRSADVS